MLYTEMVATKSAIHGDRNKILSFSPEEKPLALQVGGSNKEELAEVAKIAENMGAIGIRVEKANEIATAFQKALKLDKPVVIDIATDIEIVAPKAWEPKA